MNVKTVTKQESAPAAPVQINSHLSSPTTNFGGQAAQVPPYGMYPPSMMQPGMQMPPMQMMQPGMQMPRMQMMPMQQKGENGEPMQMCYMMQPMPMGTSMPMGTPMPTVTPIQNNQQAAEPAEQTKADPGSATQN